MKAYSCFFKNALLAISVFFSFSSFAQNEEPVEDANIDKSPFFYDYRGAHVIEVAVGTAVINGDLPDPMFEIAFRAGYKYSLLPHLNIGLSYNKFNIAFEDVYNEGFMSFDLNLEYVMSPYHKFSPFLFAGGGLNASNYFNQTATKFQGGGGFEIMAARGLGLKLMADYNYVLSDELDGTVVGASDDAYWRVLLGVNIYVGGHHKKSKILKDVPSIMNSNPIIKEN